MSTPSPTTSATPPSSPTPSLSRTIETRSAHLRWLNECPQGQPTELERCRRSALYWFDHWAWTYDPRAADDGRSPFVPMVLWPRQRELVLWLLERIAAREDGLVEKSRDIGFNWVVGGVMLHHWLFKPGFKAAFGSRKEEFVDERGNADSIFEK